MVFKHWRLYSNHYINNKEEMMTNEDFKIKILLIGKVKAKKIFESKRDIFQGFKTMKFINRISTPMNEIMNYQEKKEKKIAWLLKEKKILY